MRERDGVNRSSNCGWGRSSRKKFVSMGRVRTMAPSRPPWSDRSSAADFPPSMIGSDTSRPGVDADHLIREYRSTFFTHSLVLTRLMPGAEETLPAPGDEIKKMQDQGLIFIIARLDDETGIQVGHDLDINVFQGFYVDDLLDGKATVT